MKMAISNHTQSTKTVATLLTFALLVLAGCADSKSSKVSGRLHESSAVLYDDEDAPMRPAETEDDPLDHLHPDFTGPIFIPKTKSTRTPPSPNSGGRTPTPVTPPPVADSVPDATDTSKTPPLIPRADTTTPQSPSVPLPNNDDDDDDDSPEGQAAQTPTAPKKIPTAPTKLPDPRPRPRPVPPPESKLPPLPPRRPKAPTTTTPSAPKLQIHGFWEEKLKEGAQWTVWTVKAIEQQGRILLRSEPKDVESFCPTYPDLSARERADFWVKLISALAAAESDYHPETKYTEAFADRQGNKVVSRGLLQISIESSQQYNCGFEAVPELHDPQKNLACAVRIMSRWVVADGRIAGNDGDNWLGIGRYWSPFRSDSKKFEKIRALLRQIPVCREH